MKEFGKGVRMAMLEGLRVGQKAEIVRQVTLEWTIAALDPALPPVLGTPIMILFMELAAAEAMFPFVPEGSISVGVEVNIRHLAATPLGEQVTATATVSEVAGNLVRFEVEARDGLQLIGQGAHTRAVVNLERFRKGLEKRVADRG